MSAGDDHVIQLPKDSITLYAFVLDDNNGGMFSILIAGFSNERMDEWTVITWALMVYKKKV